MRELVAGEINFISGADNTNLYFGYYAEAMLISAYVAETIFCGYCGYQLAVSTGIVSGFVGIGV